MAARKNIVITGGSRGIGRAAAAELAADGHRLLIVGRDIARLREAQAALPEDTLIFAADIVREEDAGKLTDFIRSCFPPDGLILSAAAFAEASTQRSVTEPTADELRYILDANVTANYRLVRGLLPELERRPGARIVLIGSTAGIRRDRGGIYGISKWALRSYAYSLREELKGTGTGVTLINPGGTFTERRKKAGPSDTSLLETSDLGILIAAVFRLSPQAVIEQLDVRPVSGDTY